MTKKTQTYDLVLGAGGIKGYFHVGVLRAIEELKIKIATETGVSVGAAVALMHTNGLNAEQIHAEFKAGRARQMDPRFIQGSLVCPTLQQWLVSKSFVSLESSWRTLITEKGYKPNDRLQMLAFNRVTGRPHLFKGTDYDLATGVGASGSVPDVFAPVELDGEVLVDGALYHYNPTEFSKEPAIVVRLNRATRWPTKPLNPVDAYFHWREMYLPMVPTSMHDVDEKKNIVIDMKMDDIAGLSFFLDADRCQEMVDEGYKTAMAVLTEAIKSGRIQGELPSAS